MRPPRPRTREDSQQHIGRLRPGCPGAGPPPAGDVADTGRDDAQHPVPLNQCVRTCDAHRLRWRWWRFGNRRRRIDHAAADHGSIYRHGSGHPGRDAGPRAGQPASASSASAGAEQRRRCRPRVRDTFVGRRRHVELVPRGAEPHAASATRRQRPDGQRYRVARSAGLERRSSDQPVPEPEEVALFLMGAALLLFVLWRRGVFDRPEPLMDVA